MRVTRKGILIKRWEGLKKCWRRKAKGKVAGGIFKELRKEKRRETMQESAVCLAPKPTTEKGDGGGG